jgi:aryl-alcohol dehydrogenase-like predicted oxidoreductase
MMGPIALASSYGLPGREVERAFERGVRSFFWGALRRRDFGAALRRIARRSPVAVAVQTFARRPWLVRPSVEIARLRLGVDVIDVLGLGYWNAPPPRAIVEVAMALRDEGIVRNVVISCHARSTFAALVADPSYDAVMARYNAAHTGAERDVFPLAIAAKKPVIAYTATCWGALVGCAPEGERAPSGADCYRFALSHPAVTACLAGPKDAKELDGVLEALARGPLDEAEIAWMRRAGVRLRAAQKSRPPRRGWDDVVGIVREIRARGLTEDLLSRFNR